jgi:hypothetical protein
MFLLLSGKPMTRCRRLALCFPFRSIVTRACHPLHCILRLSTSFFPLLEFIARCIENDFHHGWRKKKGDGDALASRHNQNAVISKSRRDRHRISLRYGIREEPVGWNLGAEAEL